MSSTKERKDLIREYKESYRPMGVYRLLNRANGKVFVGSSVNLPAIFNRLRMQLRTDSYLKHPRLQQDWNEHGEDAFEFEVLEELAPPEAPGVDVSPDLAAMESLWLEELEPWDERGYNSRR